MLHIQFVALTLVAIALVASGCGGSSKTESATTAAAVTTPTTTTTPATPPVTTKSVKLATGTPLTRARLIAEAEAICEREHTKLMTVSLKTQSDYARETPQVAIYDSTEFHELSKLVPPASMDKGWVQVLSLDQLLSEYVNQIANYAQAKNYSSVASVLQVAEQVRRQLYALTKLDGIKNCLELG